jgi:S1-C subfamily serine protease
VYIEAVTPLSEAASRGLAEGDIIVEADRKEVNSPSDLRSIVEKKKGGEAVLLRIRRSNGMIFFTAIEVPQNAG